MESEVDSFSHKDLLKHRHFDTFEVIEAESQAALNRTSRMPLKKCQKCWDQCICTEGDYLEAECGQ
jgi:hypothetical protein